ncbi:GDP-mannose 4,6-dehydratase [Liquorilactobacillus satsumensis]|uniref:GDP-mannose 4,6-dehydratase n=1 Tax=Liquorilactobacillus satsumensis TaxID=259059 RepID=UPI0021C43D6C|nr:GDP-mannose 4,6-dehydratase [Liquorilactobacillus satsumensis]MCP9313137.1 GDP-mannose 4,6-dehydratase [Liquorilactobacillus satsumensis]MCP9359321.1 GDP-mannose 4,6-dehydratase [Liquorilactobacillus satsumensis]
MASYLVTGGAGFIGSNLTKKLIQQGHDVCVVDDLSMGQITNLAEKDNTHLQFYEHSITDKQFMQNLLLKNRFDYIVLLAAVASVADSIARPYATHKVNQEANINILETIRKYQLPIKKLLFSSSAAVYGNLPELPKREDSRVEPMTPYAVDKYATERFVLNYGRLYNLPTVATRFFNVYGPNQNPRSPYSGVLSIISECFKNKQEFTLFGDGSQERDFIYVEDVVAALEILLHSKAQHEVYNVATGQTVTLLGVIRQMEKLIGCQLQITKKPAREGDIQRSQADITKLRRLGFTAQNDLATGLKKYLHFSQLIEQ